MKNVRFDLKIQRSGIHGKGVFARQPISAGTKICKFEGEIVPFYSSTLKKSCSEGVNSVSAGEGKIFLPKKGGTLNYINHSCKPNCYIDDNYVLCALFDINEGSELVFDYSLSEIDLYWRMPNCYCKTDVCRGVITASTLLDRSFYKDKIALVPKRVQAFNKKFWGI